MKCWCSNQAKIVCMVFFCFSGAIFKKRIETSILTASQDMCNYWERASAGMASLIAS